MIRCERATVERAGRVVIEAVSLAVASGQAAAVVGRTGSGKSPVRRDDPLTNMQRHYPSFNVHFLLYIQIANCHVQNIEMEFNFPFPHSLTDRHVIEVDDDSSLFLFLFFCLVFSLSSFSNFLQLVATCKIGRKKE